MVRATPATGAAHGVELLQGSGDYFPALTRAIDHARAEVWLETYIFDFTGATTGVAEALLRSARRGVATRVIVDGIGTGPLPPLWQRQFDAAGVESAVYAPAGVLGLALPSRWRRLHRKLCVIDGQRMFCGGINVLDDFHDPRHGALARPRFDFAVSVRGPLAAQAREVVARQWWRLQTLHQARRRHLPEAFQALRGALRPQGLAVALPQGPEHTVARASLLLRDNLRHRGRIERAYRRAIGDARQEIIIANAYFMPGRRLRRALVLAARRGVKVRLLLQGRYEYFMQFHGARAVYGALLAAGVEIHEYTASFLHAKVAVIDAGTPYAWATVGSSNLDPLSLLLAHEANVVIEDAPFAAILRERVLAAMRHDSVRVDALAYTGRSWRQRVLDRVALGLVRLALSLTGLRY